MKGLHVEAKEGEIITVRYKDNPPMEIFVSRTTKNLCKLTFTNIDYNVSRPIRQQEESNASTNKSSTKSN